MIIDYKNDGGVRWTREKQGKDNMEKNKAGGVWLLSALWCFDHAADERDWSSVLILGP